MKSSFLVLLLVLTQLALASDRDDVIDQQIVDLMAAIKGKTVAMLTNPSSVDGKMEPLYDRIIKLAP